MEALPNQQLSSNQLFEAQAHVWNHVFSFINSMALKCAVQLCIPDIIHKHAKPMTFPELIDALPINKSKSSHFIFRLMRMVTHSGFFISVDISEEEQGYWLTPSSLLLLKDQSLSMTPFVLFHLNPIMMEHYHHLNAWSQNEHSTPFSTAHGTSAWEYAKREPGMHQMFNEAMARDAKLVSSVLVKEFKQEFEGFDSLVDVGGGTGTVAKVIADALPELKCSVLDRPQVVGGLEGSKNLSYIAGDMFVSIPPANFFLLKWILHNWNDDECVKILKNCKEALIPSKDNGGKVMIIDMVIDDQKRDNDAVETQLFYDIAMLSWFCGKQRSEEEWAKLFFDAGFSSYKIFPVLGLRSIIQVFP